MCVTINNKNLPPINDGRAKILDDPQVEQVQRMKEYMALMNDKDPKLDREAKTKQDDNVDRNNNVKVQVNGKIAEFIKHIEF